MPRSQVISAAIALEDMDGSWEVFGGELREKPAMSWGHNEVIWELLGQLIATLPKDQYRVRQNAGHLRLPSGDSYVPDLVIVPLAITSRFKFNPRTFEAYSEPLPFVVEVWSPSTGSYDIDQKIPGYRARGDHEIWRVHPFDKQVTIWRRQPDGRYVESVVREDSITLHAIPDVTIDLDALFGM